MDLNERGQLPMAAGLLDEGPLLPCGEASDRLVWSGGQRIAGQLQDCLDEGPLLPCGEASDWLVWSGGQRIAGQLQDCLDEKHSS